MSFIQKIFSRNAASTPGLGTVSGVLIPNVLQMVGVILYMRLGWITGHVGLPVMLTIIGFSCLILFLTGLSMTSIVTNMRVEGGGSYYLISRSLGIQLGTAVGVLLVISQTTSIALCVSGFCESLQAWVPNLPLLFVELVTIWVLTLISYASTNLAVKTQTLIFIVIAISIVSVFSGSGQNIPESFAPSPILESLTFWAAFSMFFPAMTGIEAGMSISGDLKNPTRSLPIGTIGAILIAFTLYSSLSMFLSSQASRELLVTYPMLATNIAKVGLLITFGIWGATLSSALGGILGAPRTLQAIAKDGMLHQRLARGVGANQLPRTAILFIALFASILTACSSINQLIPFQSMICLTTYAMINFVAFFEQVIQNPSWRPTFKTPWIVSLCGTLLCIFSMFMFNPGASFVVLGLLCVLTLWAGRKKVEGNWGDLRYSLFSIFASLSIHKLIRFEKNSKSWRPHLLTLMNSSLSQKNLAYFSNSIHQSRGFLTFGISTDSTINEIEELKNNMKVFLASNSISGFYHINQNHDSLEGMKNIIENYGLGPLSPNTIIIPTEYLYAFGDAFFQLLTTSYHKGKNVILFKAPATESPLFLETLGYEKSIHLWWRGQYQGNFELSLALSHQIQQSDQWRQSPIHIHILVGSDAAYHSAVKKFEYFRNKLRLRNLKFSPVIDPNNDFFSSLKQEAKENNLTFLGLRTPNNEETPAEYAEYLKETVRKTEIDNVAFVLAGENINFQKIFE